MNLRFFFHIGAVPDSSYEHLALRKEFGYDFLMLDTVLHRGGSRPPRIGSFPPPFRRFCISACRKAECRSHGRFVLAYQHTQGIRMLWRLSGLLQRPDASTVAGSTPASVERRRLIQAARFVLQMSAACRRFLPLAAGSLGSGPVVASSDLHVISATLFRSGYLHGPSLCPRCVSESSPTICFLCFKLQKPGAQHRGLGTVCLRTKRLLVRVAERAMRCRHLSPPDVDVSVLVGERTLHNLASRPASVLTLLWPVGLVRVEFGKVHCRALPLSYGHPFNGPGPLCTATRSCVGVAVLAPSCRCRFAPWCEASDTSLVGGPCFRKLTAEARAGSGSFGLQGADRSMRFSCNCKGAPRRSRMLDARSSLRYGSCPWVWSYRAVSLCPSCRLQNVHFLGKTLLLISMFTPAHRPRLRLERTGQSRPCERVKGSFLRNGCLRLVGQFTFGMQKLLMTLPTCFSAVQVSRSKIGNFRSARLTDAGFKECTVGT